MKWVTTPGVGVCLTSPSQDARKSGGDFFWRSSLAFQKGFSWKLSRFSFEGFLNHLLHWLLKAMSIEIDDGWNPVPCRIIFRKHNALPIIEVTSDQKVRNQGEKPALISRSTYYDIRKSYLCPIQGGLFCCARHSPQSDLVRMLTVNVPVSLRFVKRRHNWISWTKGTSPFHVDPSTFIECPRK